MTEKNSRKRVSF